LCPKKHIFVTYFDDMFHSFTFLKDSPENLGFFPKQRSCILIEKGITPYQEAITLQRSLQQQRLDHPALEDVLILLEHPPVYTLGTGANVKFLKFDPDHPPAELHRIERGGEVTYHCPGQLVGYPILNLHYHQTDLHWYLRQLEEVIIQLLKKYHLKGERIEGLTGVWLEGYKIAAIGIKVRRWITIHGFAINICPDLTGFNAIIPCGISNRPVGSLIQFIPDLTLDQVRQDLIPIFADIFQVKIIDV
jgi:lipoyl(octanoyl) transferase